MTEIKSTELALDSPLVREAKQKLEQQVKTARSNIPLTRYFEYKRADPAQKYRILAEVADDNRVREHFIQAAERQEALDTQLARERQELELAQRNDTGNADLMAGIIEDAYQRGPTLGAMIRSLLALLLQYWSQYAPSAGRRIASISKWLYDHAATAVLLPMFVICEIFMGWVFLPKGFVSQFVYFTLLSVIFTVGTGLYSVNWDPAKKDYQGKQLEYKEDLLTGYFHTWCLALSGVILAFTLFYTGWRCITPENSFEYSYFGVEVQSGQVVRTIKSTDFFTKPPSWRSTMNWHYLTYNTSWTGQATHNGLNGKLEVSATMTVRPENATYLSTSNRDSEVWKLYNKVIPVISDAMSQSNGKLDLDAMTKRVSLISTEAYALKDVKVTFKADPIIAQGK